MINISIHVARAMCTRDVSRYFSSEERRVTNRTQKTEITISRLRVLTRLLQHTTMIHVTTFKYIHLKLVRILQKINRRSLLYMDAVYSIRSYHRTQPHFYMNYHHVVVMYNVSRFKGKAIYVYEVFTLVTT